jgi:hypothetical protein
MTDKEYIELFHRAQVNLVAFKPVFHCDDELRRMVEMAIEDEREACAKEADRWSKRDDDVGAFIGQAIRARGEK